MDSKEIDERIAQAASFHKQRCNCAQCVAMSCADVVGADPDQLFRLMEGFGRGMGGHSETCGALSGGVAILSYANSDGSHMRHSKGKTYKLSRELLDRFTQKNGTTVCGELKGLTGGPRLRTCEGCIEDATRLTLEVLNDREAIAGTPAAGSAST